MKFSSLYLLFEWISILITIGTLQKSVVDKAYRFSAGSTILGTYSTAVTVHTLSQCQRFQANTHTLKKIAHHHQMHGRNPISIRRAIVIIGTPQLIGSAHTSMAHALLNLMCKPTTPSNSLSVSFCDGL